MLMTGKLTYRVDDNQVNLYTQENPNKGAAKTGTKTADLEITIDLDKLREMLIEDALRTNACKLSRVRGAIVVKAVKGSVKVNGTGRPW